MNALNPFPGYPVATIAGHLDWTATTEEISQARNIADEFVGKWRSGSLAAQIKPLEGEEALPSASGSPSDDAAVIQISGDYGTGKTHALLEIDKTLREGFMGRRVQRLHILRVVGVETGPSGWYQNSIGPVLNNLGGRSPDGGWFARLAVDLYAEAARAFLPEPDDLTNPGMAFQLVRSGILNESSVDHVYEELITKACESVSENVRSQLISLLDPRRRADAEQWLSGNSASMAGVDSVGFAEFRDGDAIDVLRLAHRSHVASERLSQF